jgi:hypothetical protein
VEGSPAVTSLKETWNSSDSVLDYSSFDGMLREGSSQTTSALANVQQPGRRYSLETGASTGDFLQQDEDEESLVETDHEADEELDEVLNQEATEEPDDEDLDQKMGAC